MIDFESFDMQIQTLNGLRMQAPPSTEYKPPKITNINKPTPDIQDFTVFVFNGI